jgi:Rho family protein
VNVVCIGFSISSPTSLRNVRLKWAEEARARCPGAPIVLIGLKKDLRDDPLIQEDMRKGFLQITTPEQGYNMKEMISARKYLKCSSLTGDGVDDVLKAATRVALLPKDRKGSGSCCVIL